TVHEAGSEPPERQTRPDIQAAATVIGRRTTRYDSQTINLSNAHLERADLIAADLTGANLQSAYLNGADLTGAHLESASLNGAHLNDADLSVAHPDGASLAGARLTSARWPWDAAVPTGWHRDDDSGLLTRMSEPAGAAGSRIAAKTIPILAATASRI